MGMPEWTPDGETQNVNKLPAHYSTGSVTLVDSRYSAELDVSAGNGAEQWLVFPEHTRVLMVEIT